MFTGIIQGTGTVIYKGSSPEGLKIRIETTLDPHHFIRGHSVSVDGVCLTVEAYFLGNNSFEVTAVSETLEKTGLGLLKVGSIVNLETPVKRDAPMSGHFVSGHVDSQAEVVSGGKDLTIEVPDNLIKYTPTKGSISINGVSLTIAEQKDNKIRVALIPETLKATNLSKLKAGDKVNVEIDMLARYMEQLSQ